MESIKISCTGDLLPADSFYTLGKGTGSNINFLIEYFSRTQNNPFTGSDLAFCNLEAPLILNSDKNSQAFAGKPASVQLLNLLGIKLVSVANNHMLDHGPDGFHQTTSLLQENGISHIGSDRNGISEPAILKIRDKKFAFAAFNSILDHPDDTLIARSGHDSLFKTLEKIKSLSPDYIIFSLHWGNEYVCYPSPEQVELAHRLIDHGVNVIIGHHPHVVQPVESYNGGVIVYSTGNFIFDMFWSEKVRNGMQVDLVFHDNRSIEYQVKPFRIRKNFSPDFSSEKWVLTSLTKSGKILKSLQESPLTVYQKTYRAECRKQRLRARIRMKLYMLIHLFGLSSGSRQFLFQNILRKSVLLWKKN